MGLAILPKTVFQLNKPTGIIETSTWYRFSDQGVDYFEKGFSFGPSGGPKLGGWWSRTNTTFFE